MHTNDDASFYRQMAQRRISARGPGAPRPMPGGPPGMPPATGVPSATGGPMPGGMNGLDPGGAMFMSLPQGTEAAFGAAPVAPMQKRPARPSPGPSGGGFMGGVF